MSSSLTILMPVYNERSTVERAIDDALTAKLPVASRQLVLVDDGSTDGTRELLSGRDWPDTVTLVLHERNRGKGAALQTGLQHATGEFSAILDADLEYRAADLNVLLEPLIAGSTNAVFGVRAFNGYTSHSFLYVMGNRAVTLACNVLFNVYLQDIMTCHKVIETELMRSLQLTASGFTIEPEITARLVQRGERIWEMPARYHARGHEEGKKLTSMDGVRVVLTLVRCRLTRPG
jgi:glycosyltransferase involved in cell wall biosynthesis